MALVADARYKGKIVDAEWVKSEKGNYGLQVEVSPDGESETIFALLWFTDGAKDGTARTLKQFNVTVTREFLEDAKKPLVGQVCSIVTEVDSYDTSKVKVKWLNGPNGSGFKKAKRSDAVSKVAELFGIEAPEVDDDESVPF